jgi:anti-anti-sigma factor
MDVVMVLVIGRVASTWFVTNLTASQTAHDQVARPMASSRRRTTGHHSGAPHDTLAPSVNAEFQVEVRREGSAAVIAISGELDLASGPRLEVELAALDAGVRLVVVDLRNLEFMDSTGLSIIVRAHQRLAEQDCELSLVRGSPQVQRLLDLTGVAERVRLVEAPEELLSGHE